MAASGEYMTRERLQTLLYHCPLTKIEIHGVHHRYTKQLGGETKLGPNGKPDLTPLPIESICNHPRMPELIHNPFAHDICKVFSSDGEGLTFLEFLDMVSSFSPRASRERKLLVAFNVYDKDRDGFIGISDIDAILHKICGDGLTRQQRSKVTKQILRESDMDGDGFLSIDEFKAKLVLFPDFVTNFRFHFV
eukprot:m.66595 g.66595  ORF g.66595 m.66595 type:complete len:192 (+) comp12126_c1_seq1:262-837(+)